MFSVLVMLMVVSSPPRSEMILEKQMESEENLPPA